MKALPLTSFLILLFSSSYSQSLVDTTPQNRTVVLEMFRGMQCWWGGAGDKLADDLARQYDGKISVIAYHSGSYARPQGNQIDLRTSVGEEIDNAAGVQGYPAGTINRSTSPWAQTRNNWANQMANIVTRSSPVNVGVQASVDRDTRQLTVDVEAYYTATTDGSDRLIVLLTQDAIAGYQNESSFEYSARHLNGKYLHMNVFRMLLTEGTWGETIDSTHKGSRIRRNYTLTLPDSVSALPLNLFALNVVAFVSNNQGDIFMGQTARVYFDKTGLTDLAIKDKTVLPEGLCIDGFTPVALVTNLGSEQITEFNVHATVGGELVTKTFKGTLNPKDSALIDFGYQKANATGTFNYSFDGFSEISNAFVDFNPLNDQANHTAVGFRQNASSHIRARFEPDKNDAHVLVLPNGHEKHGATYSTGIAGAHSKGAVRYFLHSSNNVQGIPGDILLGELDFSTIVDPIVKYAYAYSDGSQMGSAPVIRISVSEDCGTNWTVVREDTCIETGQPTSTNRLYIPDGTNDYVFTTVPIKEYANKSIMIKVSGIPGSNGNALWIDAIEAGSRNVIADVSQFESSNFSLFPNPAMDVVQIQTASPIEDVTVIDSKGTSVSFKRLQNTLDIGHLIGGVYYVQMRTASSTLVQKLVIID